LVVRIMVEKDAEQAYEITERIMVESWEEYEKGYYPREAVDFDISTHSGGHFASLIEADDGFAFVAEEEGRIVGVVAGKLFGVSGLARLGWLGVLPEFQGRGVGRQLLERAIADCRERGCHKITLYTLPVLIPAVNLYMKLGFVPEAFLRKEWWGVDFLKMSLWL
jgi:ribosomal protein S18 acetylase RimI-like enzyme